MGKMSVLLICFTLMATLVSCKQAEHEPEPDIMPETETVLSETADSVPSETHNETEEQPDYTVDEFEQSLIEYLWLNGDYDMDFVISPAVFRASLCLAASGAEGNTRTELLRAGGFAGTEEMNRWYQSFLNASEASFCRTGVSVWNDRDSLGEFTEYYETKIQQYHAETHISTEDMLTDELEHWCSAVTDGKISSAGKDIAGASSVLAGTVWIPVEMQAQAEGVLYAEENGTKILAFPMQENYSLVCFWGNRTDMFAGMHSLKPESVHAVLPDAEISSVFEAGTLLNFLLSRGVTEALNGQTANFYHMCQNADWFLQEIIQTAGISLHTASSEEEAEIQLGSPFSIAVFYGLGTSEQQMMLYAQMTTD